MSGACQPSSAETSQKLHQPTNQIESQPPLVSLENTEKNIMSKVLRVSQQEFETEVLRSEIPVVVDFYASWCPPCRALGPILDRLAAEFSGQIKFVKINSDEEPALSTTYKVTGLPTIVLVEDGENVGQFAGLPDETAFREHLNQWIASRKVAGR